MAERYFKSRNFQLDENSLCHMYSIEILKNCLDKILQGQKEQGIMKKVEIKTKRMKLRPMTDGEIESLMERIDNDELRAAYGEMLDGCKRDPENRVWHAPWKMTLKDSQESVGYLCFKGPVQNHFVEIGYGTQPEQEGHSYTIEALQAMTQWAFNQKGVVFVEAETAPDNEATQRVLEKCGFVMDGMGAEGLRFVLESPPTNWSVVYMLFGMSIGMAIGHFQDQMVYGMAIGMSLGVLLGVPFNNSEKKNREALRQQRHSNV